MATSMRLAKYESEGNDEELLTKAVVDVQDPAAPIFEAARHCQRSHDAGSVITRLDEIAYNGAAAVNETLPGVGAVKIHLGHIRLPSIETGSKETSV
jgi:hypothetical protein